MGAAVFMLLFVSSVAIAGEQVRTIPPQSEFDVSHDYFIDLLKLALEKTTDEYGLAEVVFSLPMQQGRALHETKIGRLIDVYWAGTSIDREKELIAIRIPLVKGLLGFRMGIIRRDTQELFAHIQSLDDLKHYTACQGMHWPDSDILEAAGIEVIRNPVYEYMFKQVNGKRCHYFPRGVHEGVVEMEARAEAYPDLMLYRKLIIYYPFPMYFFVTPQRGELAARIEQGLQQAISDGSFERYMREHPTTSHLFPLKRWMNTTTILLENPQLPKDTPVDDERYWIRPEALQTIHPQQ